MKIVFIGVFDILSSTNIPQFNALCRLGHTVIKFNYRNFDDPKFRDQEIVELVHNHVPDLVIFSKCNGVDVRVLHLVKNYCKVMLWYMDPLHNFNEELIEKVKAADFVSCSIYESYLKAKKLNPKSYYTIEGFDGRYHYPLDLKKLYDVSFIGSLYGERKEYYDSVRFNNFNSAYNEQHRQRVCESKINLNFTSGGTSDRVYKILASGGFLLSQPWPEMERFFTSGRDLITFNSMEELKIKIDYYLVNWKERLEIAKSGLRRVQKYNSQYWAKKIIRDYQRI